MDTETAPLPASAERAPPARAPAARIWPPLALVALYWAAGFAFARWEKPYFYGFLYGMAAPALLALACFAWWWTRRQVRLRDRLLGTLFVVAGGALVAPLCHPSVRGFGLIFSGTPIVLTAWVLWLALAKARSFRVAGPGALAVVGLTWAAFATLRIDGMDADLRGDLRWRWSPSAEDLFREEMASRGEEATPPAQAGGGPLALTAGDWPSFRGPDREGVVRGVKIATDWDARPPRLLWRRRVGPAWSSVIVVAGRLFTQEQRDDREAVVCYDAASGRPCWRHEDTARFQETVSGAGPRATPTFADGKVYALGATGILNCLDAATGEKIWSRDVTRDAGARPPGWGYSGSPLVVGDKVVVAAGGEAGKDLLAYRARDGEPAWGAAVGQCSYSSPQLVTLAGKAQVLLLGERGLSSVDPATGELLWQYGQAMAGAPRAVQAHVLGEGGLIAGSVNLGGTTRLDVTRDAAGWKAAERWTSAELRPEFPDFVVYRGHAYGFDNAIFCCVELEGGARRWKGGRYGRGQVLLLEDQGLLLVMTEKGQAVLLAANPERREEVGRFQALDGKTWNHPVISRGRLYARNAEEMACYELGVRE